MRAVLTALGTMGLQFFGAYYRLLLADALIFAGQTCDALIVLDEGLALSVRTGETWPDAELHRRKGELLLAHDQPNPIQAEQELCQAIDIAGGQAAKVFELRAATSLAHLWSGQGRRAEARDLLAPIYAWFTEGFGLPDLRQARELLAQIEYISPT
jgi:predicted ATPase